MRIHHITETEHDADIGQDFSTEKRELELFIMNDQDLYRQMFMPIIMNIVRKMKRGVYDHKLAKINKLIQSPRGGVVFFVLFTIAVQI